MAYLQGFGQSERLLDVLCVNFDIQKTQRAQYKNTVHKYKRCLSRVSEPGSPFKETCGNVLMQKGHRAGGNTCLQCLLKVGSAFP